MYLFINLKKKNKQILLQTSFVPDCFTFRVRNTKTFTDSDFIVPSLYPVANSLAFLPKLEHIHHDDVTIYL